MFLNFWTLLILYFYKLGRTNVKFGSLKMQKKENSGKQNFYSSLKSSYLLPKLKNVSSFRKLISVYSNDFIELTI